MDAFLQERVCFGASKYLKIQINLHKNTVEYKAAEESVACQISPQSFYNLERRV